MPLKRFAVAGAGFSGAVIARELALHTGRQVVVFTEFAKDAADGDIPYHPIRRLADKALLQKYYQEALQLETVSFLGRLGIYRYLDMDDVIAETLDFAKVFLGHYQKKIRPLPKFAPALEAQIRNRVA